MADKKELPEPEELGCPLYMLSFGDMMTNLLCFFILLCAFAKERRVGFISDGLGAFREALLAHGMPGVLKSDTLPMDLGARRVLFRPSKAVMPRLLVDKEGRIRDSNRDSLRDVIKKALKNEETTDIPVSFGFAPGSSDLTEDHKQVLRILTPSLIGRNFIVRLQGFAWREGLERRQEWSLAFDRAHSVMRYLVDVGNVDATRIEALGYGPPEKGSRGRETQLSWGRRSVVVSIVQKN